LAAPPTSRHDRALEQLVRRAERTRAGYTRRHTSLQALTHHSPASLVRTLVQRTPTRFWLHAVVAALIPLALLLSQNIATLVQPDVEQSTAPDTAGEAVVLSVGPIPLVSQPEIGEEPVPDSAFAEIVALPEVQRALSRQAILAPATFETVVVGDQVNVRNGPGLIYDKVGELGANTALTLEGYVEDWFVARTAEGERVWIAGELVAEAGVARGLLPPAAEIPPPPPPKIAVVGEEALNLRDGPGTAYVKLDSLAQGTTIDLLSRFENWFEVRHPSGTIGWVTGDFLQIADGVIPRLEVLPSAPDPNPALVASADGTVNLRGGPGTSYPKVSSVSGGTQLELIARYQDWLKVRTAEGKMAWVFNEVVRVSDYVVRRVPVTREIPALPRPSAPAVARPQSGGRSAPPLSAAQAGSVVNFAMQFVGTPYVWGGARPGGFDCSGYTQYVYAQFGLSLPHSAAGQYSQRYGTFISRDNLQPGDIVFFANTYKRGISHVGVYIGGGRVVQALAPGVPLAAVSMNTDYWNSKYYGAIRPNL
jgi:cell wall-associated NlpC family hydrolase